jgi:hypothetical protein
MDSVIRESSSKEKSPAAEQVDALRVDVSAEPAEPALPKLAAAWARLQDHVASTFQSSVSTCSSTVSKKTQVFVEGVDRSAITCSRVASDGATYVASTADATKSQIQATHHDVVHKVSETTESGLAKLATARAETMRKVEDTQASITDTYARAKEKTSVLCTPLPMAEANADAEPELTEDQIEQLREAFSIFDKSGDGKVTADELGTVMEECGEAVTDAEIKEMLKDVSDDGTIDFEEFKAIMTRLAAEEANLPLSRRISKVPLKMRAQWKASALASVIETFVPPPPPPPPVVPTLGNVGDMDDTTNAYVW